MSSLNSFYTTIHTVGNLSQTASLIQLECVEMTENEHDRTVEGYIQLQNIVQDHTGVQYEHPNVRAHPAAEVEKYPTASFVINVDDHHHQTMLPGEQTPGTYGEVPDYVLAKLQMENTNVHESSASCKYSLRPRRSSARVCLEKKFNALLSGTTVSSNSSVTLDQKEEQEAFILLPMQDWTTSDDLRDSVGIPNEFSLNFHPELVIKNTQSASFRKSQENIACAASTTYDCRSQTAAASGSTTRKTPARLSILPSGQQQERRERHNNNERLRRKKIRMLCNELNALVPLCTPDTDTVNTLQKTCNFLRYIRTTYGNIFQMNFGSQNQMFTSKQPSSCEGPTDQQMSVPHIIEQ
uniref:uncharacterized protein LOC131104692 n=1 Tax=Doryrhamphus excisus TaxID=161450 RepID=UPI0025ADD190|nr:uncharacterized protein LOC131104692 [Doryrhamphus excisus]XP_057908151.1 uncharacterized protein LOC131104692 [Doryrhamphus excisus]